MSAEKMRLTAAERNALRAKRAAITNVFERIAFDNRWCEAYGLPLGLVLRAFEDEDGAAPAPCDGARR